MTLIALLLDIVAAASWYVQANNSQYYFVGLVLQVILAVVLLIMIFGYRGRRNIRMNFKVFSPIFTIRFAIIVLSFLINALLVFLYYLNYTGANSVIFG
ncbi:hypothetical protein [Lacticaseibacillus jixiensis]|uniref:hypothetical protein n=1 Tax=Lacticaseibacillus jixiensis TaxID=3231926 RepID=UPI0036F1D9FB